MMIETHIQHTAAAATTPYSAWLNISWVLGAILLVFLLIIGFLRRSGMSSGGLKKIPLFQIKYSQSLGPRERLVLVEIDEQWLLLGVTADNISCLKSMEKKVIEENVSASSFSNNFQMALLNSIRQRHRGARK